MDGKGREEDPIEGNKAGDSDEGDLPPHSWGIPVIACDSC